MRGCMSQIEQFEEKVHQLRDVKAKPHLEQYAPVWITEEILVPEDSAVIFHVLFQHSEYGWVNRRYKYDSFNDVLYHKGQTLVDEDEALEHIEDSDPYIEGTVSDTRNAYGG